MRSIHRFGDEAGQSLIMAIIILSILLISSITVAQIVTSNQNISSRDRQSVQAGAAGDAGLDLAANAVQALGATTTQTSASGSNVGVDGNTVSWTASRTSSTATSWTVTSTTKSPNNKVTRVLQEQLQQTSTTATTQATAIYSGYGFVMGGHPHSGNLTPSQVCSSPSASLQTTSIGGSGRVTVPAWIDGDICVSGGSNPSFGNVSSNCTSTNSCITVHIGGSYYTSGLNCGIGTYSGCGQNTGPVASAKIVAGCWASGSPVACDSSKNGGPDGVNGGAGVYCSPSATCYSAADPVPAPDKPNFSSQVEQNAWLNASPGPNHTTCTSGSLPANIFDGNASGSSPAGNSTGPDSSLGSQRLKTWLGTTSFDCVTPTGEFAWTYSAGGVSTILVKGMVFFDGSLTISNNDYIQWDPNSNGTIYMDGSFVLSNGGYLCVIASGSNCRPDTDGWNPSNGPYVQIAAYNRGGAQYGFDLQGNSRYEGTAITNNGFDLGNSALFGGSIFADYGTVTGAGNFGVTGTTIPKDAVVDTTTTSISAWAVAPRTWRQCPVTGCS